MSMEDEQVSLKETFPNLGQGHLYKFLQGFSIDDKCIHQYEDSTEDLPHDVLKSFKSYLKQLRNMCFRDDIQLRDLQSRIIFFFQKMNELGENGLPSRAERRIVSNYQIALSQIQF